MCLRNVWCHGVVRTRNLSLLKVSGSSRNSEYYLPWSKVFVCTKCLMVKEVSTAQRSRKQPRKSVFRTREVASVSRSWYSTCTLRGWREMTSFRIAPLWFGVYLELIVFPLGITFEILVVRCYCNVRRRVHVLLRARMSPTILNETELRFKSDSSTKSSNVLWL